jgi:ribosomal-protein-alanine N-acetyltransferase
MTSDDIDPVMVLEELVFSDPWPRSAFVDVIEERGWSGLVAESDGQLAGYACFLIVDVEAHLANIAVALEHRRKSVAKHLLDRIFTVVRSRKCEFILLEVRPSNTEALAFYEKYGFRLLYRRPNYYRRPVEDALVMVRYFEKEESDT